MFELSVGNFFIWVFGGLLIGIVFLHIIPTVFKRILNATYQIKYSNYFAQKFIQERMAEGKSFQEIEKIININRKEKK